MTHSAKVLVTFTFQWNQQTHSFSNSFLYKTPHVSGSSSTHHQGLACRIRMEQSSILILHASCRQTCITCSSAECTVAKCWWWVEELPETCRVLYKNKFGNECVSWFHWKVIYYDARSYERKSSNNSSVTTIFHFFHVSDNVFFSIHADLQF